MLILHVHRFVMLHGAAHTRLADYVAEDIASVSPETTVDKQLLDFADPWDFEEVYGKLLDFAPAYPFDPEAEDYLVHITGGGPLRLAASSVALANRPSQYLAGSAGDCGC